MMVVRAVRSIMASPGEVRLLSELADGTLEEYEPTIDETGEVQYPTAAERCDSADGRASEVLASLAKRGLLERAFDTKVYVCPECSTEGMQYTTACPNCESTHVVEQEVIRHEECGHLAPPTRFEVSDGAYVCPECESTVDAEEIERDYRYHCQNCESIAEAAEHRLWCRSCRSVHPPDDAVERALYRYALTSRGERWLESQLSARRATVDELEARQFETEVDASVVDGERSVHVFATDELLDRRIVADVHERLTEADVTALRDAADAAGAQPVLVITAGAIDPRVEEAGADLTILTARDDGTLEREYDVVEEPHDERTFVQRIASAVDVPTWKG